MLVTFLPPSLLRMIKIVLGTVMNAAILLPNYKLMYICMYVYKMNVTLAYMKNKMHKQYIN